MFFFLSKTLNYLTMPLVVIVLLMILSGILKRAKIKKWLFRIALSLLIFLSNDFIANEVIGTWELPTTPFADMRQQYEWGILLCGVSRTQVWPKDRIHFSRGADRAIHTVYLYKKGLIKKILVSGGEGKLIPKGVSEAEDLAKALVMMGIPEQDILIEGKSRNTYESAVEVKNILKGITAPEQCLLITSGFHMRRSRACFAKVGFPMATFTAETLVHNRSFDFDVLFIPKLDAMIIWHSLIREWVGMFAYKIAGYI